MTTAKSKKIADLIEKAEAERKAEWVHFISKYPARVASLIFNYMNIGGDFRVKSLGEYKYEFTRHDHLYRTFELSVTPPETYCYETLDAITTLEQALVDYQEELDEQLRRYNARSAALAKLTVEERKLLGL